MPYINHNLPVGTILDEVPEGKLAYTVAGFSRASSIGTTRLYRDIKAGLLPTYLVGTQERKKRLIFIDDGITYIKALPKSEEVAA